MPKVFFKLFFQETKMKNNILKIIGIVLLSVLAAFGAGQLSLQSNPDVPLAIVKGFVVFSSTSYLLSYAFKLNLDATMLMCTTLIGVKRKCNNVTMGGIKRLYLVLCEDLQNDFLSFSLAMSAGEFSGAIPLVAGKKFIEVEAWYDSTKADGEMKSGTGFTQGLEFKILGYDKDIVKFQALLYETPVNAIIQGNDDRLYYVGSKYIPLMFDTTLVIPEKGTARKEVTFKAKNEGFQHPIMPLGAATTFEVTALIA